MSSWLLLATCKGLCKGLQKFSNRAFEQTRSTIMPLRNHLEQTDHLLAILVGRPPESAATQEFTLTDFRLAAELPLRAPSDLVHRRPDILASEALLHAASAQHGVAVSRLYPEVTLSANLGSHALNTASLFGPNSVV